MDFIMGVLTALVAFCAVVVVLAIYGGWRFARWAAARGVRHASPATGRGVTMADGRRATIMTEYSLQYPHGRDVLVADEDGEGKAN